MSDNELTFRGESRTECLSFIREVHRRARDAGGIENPNWIARFALPAFDGEALIWFDQQPLETQADWILLRRALIERFCDERSPRPAPPAIVPEEARPADHPTSIQVNPSARVNAIGGNDSPTFVIKVVAPKIGFVGYVSKVWATTGLGRVCSLVQTVEEAFELKCYTFGRPNPSDYRLHSKSDTRRILGIRFSDPNDWSNGTLNVVYNESSTWLDDCDGPSIPAWGVSAAWSIGTNGNVRPYGYGTEPHLFVIGRLDNKLTLNYWKFSVWDRKDEDHVAELYYVRTA